MRAVRPCCIPQQPERALNKCCPWACRAASSCKEHTAQAAALPQHRSSRVPLQELCRQGCYQAWQQCSSRAHL